MSSINEFNAEDFDLLTESEKKFNEAYIQKLTDYVDGKGDGVHIKNLTAGAATVAKRQQSRSNTASLMHHMANKNQSFVKIVAKTKGKK